MKRTLLFLAIACFTTSLVGQSLLWESDPDVRPRNLNLGSFIFSQSTVLSDDFNSDGFTDVVTSVIYRDSLFFRVRLLDDVIDVYASNPAFTPSTQFLGYLQIPDIPGESITSNRPLVFGTTNNGNIIGILVGRLAEDLESTSFKALDIGASYRFLSFSDFNEDGAVDFTLFNRDERRIQVWQF